MPGIRSVLFMVLAAGVLSTSELGAQEADPARLYGRVETTDGSVYEGFIRWAGNEGGLYDILSATKRVPERNRRDAERLGWEPDRRERFEIFGIGITLPTGGDGMSSSAQSGIRFGHVSSLEVTGSNRVMVLLKSGGEVEFVGGGDVGSSVDEILVEGRRGQVELDWRDVRVIDFMAPPSARSRWGDRLYGTLHTRYGDEFTGYIAWDMDELFGSDILDGDVDGRDLELPFSEIRAIERYGSGAARVALRDGDELVLSGSNDVNSSNRDIMVADPGLGEIRVEWDAFHRLELRPPPADIDASPFDRGGRLRGTVRARGGERHAGWIRWDNDEEYGWEILDGELADGIEVDVEFSEIRSIRRVAYDACQVTLRDGRILELTGSNDVDEDNKGIYVERSDGTLVLIPWDRFEEVEFDA